MKKRLFISSILMTLVLLVAITTATFAWYKAGAATANDVDGSKHAIQTIDSVTIGAQGYGVEVEVTLVPANDTKLQLAHYDSTAGWQHFYALDNAGANLVPYNGETGLLNSKAYEVKIEAKPYTDSTSGASFSKQQVADMIAAFGCKVTITVPASYDFNNDNTAETNNMASRTLVWASANTISDNAAPVPSTTTNYNTFTVAANAAVFTGWTGDALTIGYVAISVEGNVSSSYDSGNLNIVALVTVDKA